MPTSYKAHAPRSQSFQSFITPTRFWISFFALWAFFLSGFLGGFVGSPGILQASRLNRLLKSKETQVRKLEDNVISLQAEAEALVSDPLTQRREIRKVLGYVAPDEIVFDFSKSGEI